MDQESWQELAVKYRASQKSYSEFLLLMSHQVQVDDRWHPFDREPWIGSIVVGLLKRPALGELLDLHRIRHVGDEAIRVSERKAERAKILKGSRGQQRRVELSRCLVPRDQLSIPNRTPMSPSMRGEKLWGKG